MDDDFHTANASGSIASAVSGFSGQTIMKDGGWTPRESNHNGWWTVPENQPREFEPPSQRRDQSIDHFDWKETKNKREDPSGVIVIDLISDDDGDDEQPL